MKRHIFIIILIFSQIFLGFAEDKILPDTESKKSARDTSLDIIYLGEMYLRASLGLNVPLFSSFFNDKTIGDNGFTNNTKIYGVPVGGSASLEFVYFLENNIGLGAELSGKLLKTKLNLQYIVALGGVFQYMFRVWPWDIPLYINAGVYFNTLQIEDSDRIFFAGPYLKPGFSFFYNINEHWSVGSNTNFWIMPELYFDEKKNQSNFTFFWDIAFSVRYKI